MSQQIGRPVQNVRVLPGTTVSSVLVVDQKDGCPKGMPLPEGDTTCEDSRGLPYSSDKSLKWVPNSIFSLGIEKNLGLDSNGNFGFDDVTLGWQGGGGPTETHQVVGSVADPNYWLGRFPLNTASCNFTTYNSPQPSVSRPAEIAAA